ncbi:MAG: hypothetical protein D6730_07850, partial [Bacteroidetes bacterium]
MSDSDSLIPQDESILSHPLVKYMEGKLLAQQSRIQELELAYSELQQAYASLLSDYLKVVSRV